MCNKDPHGWGCSRGAPPLSDMHRPLGEPSSSLKTWCLFGPGHSHKGFTWQTSCRFGAWPVPCGVWRAAPQDSAPQAIHSTLVGILGPGSPIQGLFTGSSTRPSTGTLLPGRGWREPGRGFPRLTWSSAPPHSPPSASPSRQPQVHVSAGASCVGSLSSR